MKSKLGFIAVATLGLCAACASDNKAPANTASSRSIDAATDTPNTQPNFAPARADGMATATTKPDHPRAVPGTNPPSDDTRVERGDTSVGSRNARSSTSPAGSSGDTNAGYASSPSDTTSSRAVNGDSHAGPTPSSSTTDTSSPDNTRVNKRDRDDKTLLPTDQGSSEADRNTTQQIRQALMKDNNLSFTAKNVKIITVNGKVTLRGPVNSAAERSAIEAAARKIAGVSQVDNQLELKNDTKK